MKFPRFLQDNGTIGFVAPSCGCGIEPYHTAFVHAQENWKNMGYGLDLGPNCYKSSGIGISSTPKDCGRELTEYYLSKDNDVLISCGGGELMCETLDYVDFQAITQAEPKWYMGYSDNTNMTYLLATICDTASIYGPCAGTFGMEPWHQSLQDAMDMLTGRKLTVSSYPLWERDSLKDAEHPLVPYHVTKPRVHRYYDGSLMTEWKPGSEMVLKGDEIPRVSFSGRLLGGCMDCLVNLLGTSYDHTVQFVEKYKEDGIIWFLEACDLNVFGIRRAMWQMERAGWFQYVKGFLIGRPVCHGQEAMGLDIYGAVLEIAGRKKVPVMMDVDIGHLSPMMPIVVGSMANVLADGNEMSIEMELR